MGIRTRLPHPSTTQPGPATLARPLQPATATQLTRRPATNQPRSQRPWVGHLARRKLRAGALAADVAADLVPAAADAAVPDALEIAEDRVVGDVVSERGVVVEVEVVADDARRATGDVGRRQAARAADAERGGCRVPRHIDVAHDDAVADDVQARVEGIARAGGVAD